MIGSTSTFRPPRFHLRPAASLAVVTVPEYDRFIRKVFAFANVMARLELGVAVPEPPPATVRRAVRRWGPFLLIAATAPVTGSNAAVLKLMTVDATASANSAKACALVRSMLCCAEKVWLPTTTPSTSKSTFWAMKSPGSTSMVTSIWPAAAARFTGALRLPATVTFWIETRGWIGVRTVTEAAPTTVGETVEAAVIVAAPGATAVATPADVTVTTALLLEVHVTVRATPGSASTLATKPCVPPGFIVTAAGETTTLRTAGATTVIVTLAFLLTSAVAVAVMLAVPAAAAVTRPLASTDATFAALEAQVTASLADN